MNPWPFILGAYAVTAIVIIAEIVAWYLRHRAAVAALEDGAEAEEAALADQPLPSKLS